MSDLKNSILFLLVYIFTIFGVAQIDFIEQNILNFDPTFFILVALAVLSAFFLVQFTRISIYQFLVIWSVVYITVRLVYWAATAERSIALILLEFVLVDIAAGLAYDIGRQMVHVNSLLDKLTTSIYPNQTLELRAASDRINVEFSRSRRYRRPLSLLVMSIEKLEGEKSMNKDDALKGDILSRFAIARIGQVMNDRVRETDLILRDTNSRFLILCPETEYSYSNLLAERISKSVAEVIGARVTWGSASFPAEALTFDDLVRKATERLAPITIEQATEKAAETLENKVIP